MERKIHLVIVKGNVQEAEGNKSATTRQEPLKIKSRLFFNQSGSLDQEKYQREASFREPLNF